MLSNVKRYNKLSSFDAGKRPNSQDTNGNNNSNNSINTNKGKWFLEFTKPNKY